MAERVSRRNLWIPLEFLRKFSNNVFYSVIEVGTGFFGHGVSKQNLGFLKKQIYQMFWGYFGYYFSSKSWWIFWSPGTILEEVLSQTHRDRAGKVPGEIRGFFGNTSEGILEKISGEILKKSRRTFLKTFEKFTWKFLDDFFHFCRIPVDSFRKKLSSILGKLFERFLINFPGISWKFMVEISRFSRRMYRRNF